MRKLALFAAERSVLSAMLECPQPLKQVNLSHYPMTGANASSLRMIARRS